MTKIIALNGSPRRTWNTAQMVEAAVRGAADAGAECELIHLTDLKYTGCLSCFGCKRLGGKSFGRCALRDDLTEVLEKVLTADGVIIGAPIYFGDVTGMVRNLFERIWFPGLLYSKDGSIAYTKRVKTALIYTMNCPDENFYKDLIGSHKATFERLVGETETLCAVETWQFDDYSKYASTMFDVEARRKRHEEVFPQDLQKAFELGRRMAGSDAE